MHEFTESDTATVIDSDVSFDDDSTDFNGATLVVTIVNPVGTEDDLGVDASLYSSIVSNSPSVNGTNDTSISFQFNGSATESSIIDLLQGITYDNSNDDNPDSTDRQVSFTFTDVGVLNSGSIHLHWVHQPIQSNHIHSKHQLLWRTALFLWMPMFQ